MTLIELYKTYQFKIHENSCNSWLSIFLLCFLSLSFVPFVVKSILFSDEENFIYSINIYTNCFLSAVSFATTIGCRNHD